MKRRTVGYFLLGVLIFEMLFAKNKMAISGPCGEQCGLQVQGDLVLSIGGIVMGAFMALYPQIISDVKPIRPVLLWRRSSAFLIDFYVIFSALLSLEILILLIGRYTFTGHWEWYFTLPKSVPALLAEFMLVGGTFLLLHAYFWMHAKRGKATIGKYIMGYQIVPDSEFPIYGWGALFAYFALCSVHIWIWFKKEEDSLQGWYWWDRLAGTRAVMTKI